MKASEQGVGPQAPTRHQVIPRTLIFVTRMGPQTSQTELLLLKGAPDKRLWANKFNGLGGHIEAGEDVYAAARREVMEEAGLTVQGLTLRGTVHIDIGQEPGVMLFVFSARTDHQEPQTSPEGPLYWLSLPQLADYPLVDDLYQLIPLTLDPGPTFHAHYALGDDGAMAYRFYPEK